MNYRLIKQCEYKSIANLHLKSFDNFFLSTLGPGFLKTYYRSCLLNNHILAVCCVNDDDEIVGFCLGCVHAKGFHKKLIFKNCFKFSFEAIKIIFTKPKAIIRLLKNMDKKSNSNDDGNYAELLSIAVSPDYSNLGIGKELIAFFEIEALKKGVKKIALTTDFYENDQVLSFYRKSGYSEFYTFCTYPERKMYKFIKEIRN